MQFPSIEDLRARNTMKWTRYGQGVLPLWVAESDFSTCPAVLQAITDAVQREAFGYPPDGSLLSQATAEFYADRYGYQARPEWIFPIPDVVRGLYIAIDHFTPAQSKVIVPTPAYPPFFSSTLCDPTRRHIYRCHWRHRPTRRRKRFPSWCTFHSAVQPI
ncbi:plastocyanin [Corynebacterium diphtheriae]|nr:plastocyanin [Corynebacterium diphtheriae]